MLLLLQELSLVCLVISIVKCNENERAPITIARTEIKVSRSINPENTQTLNVMTRDGNVAQLIVKKRDSKTKTSIRSPLSSTQDESGVNDKYRKSFYTNWIPISSVYLQPNIIRLDAIALVRNSTDTKKNKFGNIIDSDRYVNTIYFLYHSF